MSVPAKSNKQDSNRSNNLVRNTVHVAVLAALAAASAATQAQQAPGSSDNSIQEVIVTGSRIKRTDSETPSPVQIINEAELKQSGYNTISEVLRNLTANGAGTLSNGFPGAFAGGATGVSLRGLNTSATLVMIDGHRMAPHPLSDDNQRSFVDVSSIPFDAVERVEVLKDGASAVYGSDAMAGVVNIILKKSFVGTTTSAEGGTSQEGGGTTEHATLTHGIGDLAADGYNAYVSLEYRHAAEIDQRQRQGDGLWSSFNQTSIGGRNATPGVINGAIGASIPPAFGTVYLTAPGAYSAATSDFYASPIKPNSAYVGNCTFALQASGGCAFLNPHEELAPATQNLNFLASFKKKLGDAWLLDVKGSVFDSRGEEYRVSTTADGLTVFPTSLTQQVAMSATSPAHLAGATIPAITVPANYPGNTLGVAAFVRGVMLDAPSRHRDYNTISYRFVADVTGNLLGWDIDTSLGYTRVNLKQWEYSLVDRVALFNALNRASNPFLITGGNTAADLAAIYPVGTATDTSELAFGEFNASKALFALPGGDLGLSAGAQLINRELNAPAPEVVALGLAVGGNPAFVQGSQSDAAVYTELAAPIFKMLEVDGQVRYDHFNNAGSATTPSAGFKFKPIEEFAFRGTWGKGFRAPNPAENGKAGASFGAGTGFDPILCPGGNATAAGAVTAYCSFSIPNVVQANPKLKPEKSTSATLGFVVQPFNAWSTTVDYYDVKVTGEIVNGAPDPANPVRGAPISSTCANGTGGTYTCTTSVGPILYFPVAYINLNATEVRGWEADTSYKLELGDIGTVTAELDWSHVSSYLYNDGTKVYELAGTHGPAVVGGDTGNPKDRGQASFQYERGGLSARLTVNYISSFDLTDPSGSNAGVPVLTCLDGVQNGGYDFAYFPGAAQQPTDNKYCRVQAFFDTDITATYKFPAHWTVNGAITNLLNAQPPVDLNTYGGGDLRYNPSLHQTGAIGRFFMVGVRYDF